MTNDRNQGLGAELYAAVQYRSRRLVRIMRGVAPRAVRHAVEGALAVFWGHPGLLRHRDLSAGLSLRRREPKTLFVGWLLTGGWDDGAARAHGLVSHFHFRQHFRRLAVNSVLLRTPRRDGWNIDLIPADLERIVSARFDVVVFQGVHGPGAQQLARTLRATGTRTIYTTGDLCGDAMAGVVDWVVAGSDGLTAVAGQHRDRCSVIESVLESPAHLVKDHSQPSRDGKTRVVWVGYPENLHLLAPVRAALADPRLSRFELVTISRGPGVTHQWHRRRVWPQLLACDIAVLPSADTAWYQAKPNTRMVMLKALGLPSIASPLASYCQTLTHGQSCYFARTPEEWVAFLLALSDPTHRREIGLADRKKILETYGVEAISRRWLDLFRQLCADSSNAGTWTSGGNAGRRATG